MPLPSIKARASKLSTGSYRFSAKGAEAEIYLYGDVGDDYFGGITASQVKDDLKAAGDVKNITVRINSMGGDVFQGLTIYRLLVESKATITVHIDGVAASIASVIAMAGKEIIISEGGFLMIHNAWGVGIGDAEDMRTLAKLLETTTGSLRDVYVARTGNDEAEVKSWMDAETWFTGEDAVKNHFADKVAANLKVAAKFDPAVHKFRNAPRSLAGTPNVDAARKRLLDMKNKLSRAAA